MNLKLGQGHPSSLKYEKFSSAIEFYLNVLGSLNISKQNNNNLPDLKLNL